jgi:phosphoglucosamine mutase
MKIFGTDGIRGQANTYPMTAELALKVGMAVAIVLDNNKLNTNRVVIGKDTRLSGYMIETALTSGLTSMGKDVFLLGPMPTPAVAMLTRSTRSDLGVMISASHNPHYDNGIKIFDSKGYKLSDDLENEIVELLEKDLSKYLVKPNKIGRVERLKESTGRYIEHIKGLFPDNFSLSGLKIVVDCANGANYKIAPVVFYELGAQVIAIGNNPNGLNINENCGSTHLEALKAKVLESGSDIGVAFDGDADRLMMIDEKGGVIDGDKILSVIATNWKKLGKLNNDAIVGTIMANKGFENYLNSVGIQLYRSAVGDRYVSELLIEKGLNLGGEQSGHILLPQYNTTGDGLLACLEVLNYLMTLNKFKKASFALNLYEPYPQYLKNFTYSQENPLQNKFVEDYINKITQQNPDLRILIRKSGTESLIRVMVEGKDSSKAMFLVDEIIININKIIKD